MSSEAARRLQPGDGTTNSTQRGCTSWLLISVVVLTTTTAFVFGWGLGAPNMYNKYTEPFLRVGNSCAVNENAPAKLSPPPAAAFQYENQNAEPRTDSAGNEINPERSSLPNPLKEPFKFIPELIKGIPQTMFLIGAFLGAVSGPLWATYFDRKRTVFANYVFCFASSLCVLLAAYLNMRSLFYISRLLLGYQGKCSSRCSRA